MSRGDDMTAGAKCLCVALHDVAPQTWPACQRVIDAINEVAPIPLTLLAVPRYRHTLPHPCFERKLEQQLALGNELALHGYTHVDELPVQGLAEWMRRRFYTAGEGEFAALSAPEAEARLEAGRLWFSRNGWPLHGFVAPAWLLSHGSWQALQRSDFLYTSTLGGLHALHSPAALMRSQGQVFSTRSAWRRIVSIAWNRLLARRQCEAKLIRLELHPWDADYPAVRRNWQALLRAWLETRTPMTGTDFVLRHMCARRRGDISAPLRPDDGAIPG